MDDEAATREIAQYVLDRGYKTPFYLAGPRTTSAHLKRKETFCQIWHDNRAVTPECDMVDTYDPIASSEVVYAMLRDRPPDARPDIIVCENDALALGAIDTIRHRLGLSVPEDIAVIGFDDVPQAATANYDLTTYRQPITEMAHYLVDVLESTEDDTSLNKAFLGKLVIRNSA